MRCAMHLADAIRSDTNHPVLAGRQTSDRLHLSVATTQPRKDAMIEKIVKVLEDTARQHRHNQARAVLDAMREPTPEMIEAAEGVGIGPKTAAEVYRAMITACSD